MPKSAQKNFFFFFKRTLEQFAQNGWNENFNEVNCIKWFCENGFFFLLGRFNYNTFFFVIADAGVNQKKDILESESEIKIIVCLFFFLFFFALGVVYFLTFFDREICFFFLHFGFEELNNFYPIHHCHLKCGSLFLSFDDASTMGNLNRMLMRTREDSIKMIKLFKVNTEEEKKDINWPLNVHVFCIGETAISEQCFFFWFCLAATSREILWNFSFKLI